MALRLVRWEVRGRILLRAARSTSGWAVASLLLVLLAFTERVWVTSAALLLVLSLAAIQWWSEQRALELSSIRETDSLSGYEFERWLREFFERLGFTVEHTPYRGDFGADLIVTWNGIRTAVQAKCGHSRVGVAAVQQAATARHYYNCERAMVVTNQYFTPEAILLADAAGVELRNRTDLAQKLRRPRS